MRTKLLFVFVVLACAKAPDLVVPAPVYQTDEPTTPPTVAPKIAVAIFSDERIALNASVQRTLSKEKQEQTPPESIIGDADGFPIAVTYKGQPKIPAGRLFQDITVEALSAKGAQTLALDTNNLAKALLLAQEQEANFLLFGEIDDLYLDSHLAVGAKNSHSSFYVDFTVSLYAVSDASLLWQKSFLLHRDRGGSWLSAIAPFFTDAVFPLVERASRYTMNVISQKMPPLAPAVSLQK